MPSNFNWLFLATALLCAAASARHQAGEGRGSFETRRPESIDLSLKGNDLVVPKSLVGNDNLVPDGQAVHIDNSVDYGKACLIVGYHDKGENGTRIPRGNAYASNMYEMYKQKQYAARSQQGQLRYGQTTPAAPDVQRVGNVSELLAAIEKCPKGSPLVIATHGYGQDGGGGGFWLSEEKKGEDPYATGLVVASPSSALTKLADTIAARGISQVTLHSCSIGQSAANGMLGDAGLTQPGVKDNFGNVLVTALYERLPKSAPVPNVVVFSKPVYGGSTMIVAREEGTRRLTFRPDNVRPVENKPPVQVVVNNPPSPPVPVVNVPPSSPNLNPISNTPPVAPPIVVSTKPTPTPVPILSTMPPAFPQPPLQMVNPFPTNSLFGSPSFGGASSVGSNSGGGGSGGGSEGSGEKSDKPAVKAAKVAAASSVGSLKLPPPPPEVAPITILIPAGVASVAPAPTEVVMAPPPAIQPLDLRAWTAPSKAAIAPQRNVTAETMAAASAAPRFRSPRRSIR